MDVEADVSTPRRLYRELSKREAPSAEKKEELLEYVQKLAFHQRLLVDLGRYHCEGDFVDDIAGTIG